jgi:ankyrin repeat protein
MTEDIVAEWITTLVKDYGADINARSWVNEAPLHSAIKQRNVVSTKTLLQLGADVNARGFGSMTPLHYILDINQVLHSANVYTMSEDLRICVDGYKIVANTIVRYPSWMWSSLDDHSQNPVTSFYESESDHCVALFIELFKHAADKIDFNVQSFLGNLPLHGCWTLAKNITDATKIAQGVVDPNQFLLTIPLTMLKYATREQLLTKNFAETTPFEGMITSNLTTLKPNSMSGLYPGVKEAYDIVFKRCLELIGDTVDINHVITATSMQCEYNVIELLANKAKENGKFNISDLKKANHGSVSLMLTNVLTDPKIYTLLKDIVGPLWSKSLDRGHTSPTIDPALFNFVAVYSNACGYDEKVSRPKMLDELIKTGGADWNVQAANTNENLLHAALSWFRNVSGDGLLFNQIWTRKTIMEADKILYDLIKIGVDPHHKSVIGQSFADLVPQYEKILANHEILMGEQKSVQKENYFVEKKPTMLKQLMQAISVTRT